MQLNPPLNGPALRLALGAATAALLAPGWAAAQTAPTAPTVQSAQSAQAPAKARSAAAPTASSTKTWQVDSAVLFYAEGGGRVRAVEPVVSARLTDGNDVAYGLKLTLDALTGASPNGAAPQPTAQTFTSPSGKSTYTTAANQAPLDPSFKDTRVALSGSLDRPWGDRQRLSLGANLSSEYDFVSAAVNASLARDYNNKNTTLSVGVAFEADQIKPVGGMPAGLQPVVANNNNSSNNSNTSTAKKTRTVSDLLLGVTQVMNRRWLTQVNLGWGMGSGAHSDPYKLLSVVNGSTGLLTGDRYVSESRPDKRTRTSLYWRNLVHLDRDVVDVGYRFYSDDWGLRAHTLDLRYRWQLAGGVYVEPRWRGYRQTAADFSRGWLQEGVDWSSSQHQATQAYASADTRLAAFSAQTVGIKLGMPAWGGEFTARVEAYRQQITQPAAAPGVLGTLQVMPDLRATTVVLGYSLPF